MTRALTLLRRTAGLAVMVPLAALLFAAPVLAATTAPNLRSAGSFAVLGGPVTCTNSIISGQVGVYTGFAFTDNGCTIPGGVNRTASRAGFDRAFDALADMPCPLDHTLTGTLAGVTLSSGVYCFAAAAAPTGKLTLTGSGPWIFQIGAALEATNFTVVSSNPCNVFWQVNAAATLTTSQFLGTILAGVDITVTGGTVHGDLLAHGAVTLTNTTVTACAQTKGGNGHGTHCNQGVGNGPEGCDPGNSNQGNPSRSNDELGGTPGNPGRKGGNK